jgi:hypothetical protein
MNCRTAPRGGPESLRGDGRDRGGLRGGVMGDRTENVAARRRGGHVPGGRNDMGRGCPIPSAREDGWKLRPEAGLGWPRPGERTHAVSATHESSEREAPPRPGPHLPRPKTRASLLRASPLPGLASQRSVRAPWGLGGATPGFKGRYKATWIMALVRPGAVHVLRLDGPRDSAVQRPQSVGEPWQDEEETQA